MEKQMRKFVGQTVTIIYCGQDGSITQRDIDVRSVGQGTVNAFCLQRRAPRVFRIENILAVQKVVRHAV